MSCPFSITTSVGFGFYASDNQRYGFAANLELSSSDIQVPIVGIGLSASGQLFSSGGGQSGFQILAEGIPSSLGNVYVRVKNLTTGQVIGPATLSSTTTFQNNGGSFSSSFNTYDQVVLLIHSDNPGTLPSIMWRVP